MSQQLAVQSEDKLSTWLARPDVNERIGSALGGYLDTEMFLSHHLIHIQSKPELAECSVASQYQAIHTCAMLGLMAGYQQVALIPRAKQLTVMPQWQGYKALFERVAEVFEVRAACVHVNDLFEVAGDAPDLIVNRHQYDPFDPQRTIEKLEDIKGSYVVFTFRDGRPPRYHFASAAYISKCRSCAQTQVIWNKWFEQMALKTAFRSAFSRRVVNVDPMVAGRLEAFTRHEDALLGNDPRIIEHNPQALPTQSRSAVIAGQIAQRQSAPVPTAAGPMETPPVAAPSTPLDPTPAAQGQEPVAGELTDEEPQAEGESPQSVMGQFLDMLATVKNRREVERLRDHFTHPDSEIQITAEEREEINTACNSKLNEFPTPPVPAKPSGSKQQKPLMQ